MKSVFGFVFMIAMVVLCGGCAICGGDMPRVYGEKYLQKHGEPKTLVDDVCNHKPLSPETFERLAAYSDPDVNRLLGENPSCPAALLTKYSESPNWFIRRGVAINSKTPGDLLKKLSVDPDWRVRNSIGANRSIPPAMMQTIADSDDWAMQTGLAGNPSASPAMLRQIYDRYKNDENKQDHMRSYLATNRQLPEDIARDIYLCEKDKSESLTLDCLVMNPAVSSSLLLEIYQNNKSNIELSRYSQNPHCPPEIKQAYKKAEAEKAKDDAQQRAKERAREQKRQDNAGVKWL